MAALDADFLLRFALLDLIESTGDLQLQERNRECWGTCISQSKLGKDCLNPVLELKFPTWGDCTGMQVLLEALGF